MNRTTTPHTNIDKKNSHSASIGPRRNSLTVFGISRWNTETRTKRVNILRERRLRRQVGSSALQHLTTKTSFTPVQNTLLTASLEELLLLLFRIQRNLLHNWNCRDKTPTQPFEETSSCPRRDTSWPDSGTAWSNFLLAGIKNKAFGNKQRRTIIKVCWSIKVGPIKKRFTWINTSSCEKNSEPRSVFVKLKERRQNGVD